MYIRWSHESDLKQQCTRVQVSNSWLAFSKANGTRRKKTGNRKLTCEC